MFAGLNDQISDVLAEQLEESVAAPPKIPHQVIYKRWRPNLNKGKQVDIYDSTANYLLCYGERGSGKTQAAIHKLVRHSYENENALSIIIVGVKRQAEEGGAWYKLLSHILPEWERGLGLDHDTMPFYTEPKTNTAKDVFLWILNRFGGWSRVLLLSMPVEGFVASRVKGMEPSFIFIDEAQTLDSDTYFTSIIQQIGRRPGITTNQQIIYCANPAGPSHWLYHRFFELPIDDETGEWNTAYANFHVPVIENLHNLPLGYWERVLEAVKGDEVEEARMVRGEWVDKPEGAALFKEVFRDALHIRGDYQKGKGLQPAKGFDVIIGYDLGAAHSSVTFMQHLGSVEKYFWMVFDELNFVGQYMPYFKLVPILVNRMIYWEKKIGCNFRYRHISDNSAFNQYRARDGSFDAWDIEEISSDYVKKNSLEPRFVVRLEECPKGAGSVEARVRSMSDLLIREDVVISAVCRKTREMLLGLEEDKKERFKPKRSNHVHSFDSFTYPILFFNAGRGRHQSKIEEVETAFYVVGQRPRAGLKSLDTSNVAV